MNTGTTVIAGCVVAAIGAGVGLAVGSGSSETVTETVTDTTTETATQTVMSTESTMTDTTATADAAQRAAIRTAFLGGVNADPQIYGIYTTTQAGVDWAAVCVDRAGYANSVYGRALVYRAGTWEVISSFNQNNIGSDPWTANGSSSEIPQPVYEALQPKLRKCAARIGANLGPN